MRTVSRGRVPDSYDEENREACDDGGCPAANAATVATTRPASLGGERWWRGSRDAVRDPG